MAEGAAGRAGRRTQEISFTRGRELGAGGGSGQGIASDESGERVSASRLLRVMWRAAEELAATGELDRQTLEGYVFTVYCRTTAEAMKQLESGGELAGKLELVSERFDEVPNKYWE